MARSKADKASVGQVMAWIESKPAPLGEWFTQQMIVASYPGRTNLLEVERALKKLSDSDVVVKCSVPPRSWYVWKSSIDAALEGE